MPAGLPQVTTGVALLTVTWNVSVEVAPRTSVAVTVMVAVPAWPGSGVTVSVRLLLPVPLATRSVAFTNVGLDDVAVNDQLDPAEPVVTLIGTALAVPTVVVV